jgi:predicted acetyltransferase
MVVIFLSLEDSKKSFSDFFILKKMKWKSMYDATCQKVYCVTATRTFVSQLIVDLTSGTKTKTQN